MLPFATLIPVHRNAGTPVYLQIANGVLSNIKKGVIPPGTRLPGTRELARLLQVHRKTVIAAYEDLSAQGWIIPKNKSGFFVTEHMPLGRQQGDQPAGNYFPEKAPIPFYIPVTASTNHMPVVTTKRPTLILDDGLPDARLAPYDLLTREYKALSKKNYIIRRVGGSVMHGAPKLRESIARLLVASRGINAQASNVQVTSGAQMAVHIAAKLFLQQGDIVLTGEPGYTLAKTTFLRNGARVLEVPVDKDGVQVDIIEQLCRKHTVKVVYIIPHHHYPTTVTLSLERRMKLLALAARYQFMILEDDYDYDFHYSSSPHLPLASYHHQGRVIYIGSFSKSFAPSLRIGFMVGTRDLVDAGASIRRFIDLRGDYVMEEALSVLINNGDLERHIRRTNRIYKERRDHLCSLLDSTLRNKIRYNKPAGGMAVWIEFNAAYRVDQLASLLAEKGILMSPHMIFLKPPHLNALRLGFASLDQKEGLKTVTSLQQALTSISPR